jgi:DNA-binding GntR family transcriptional regulator
MTHIARSRYLCCKSARVVGGQSGVSVGRKRTGNSRPVSGTVNIAGKAGWQLLRPLTLVDRAADAIIAGAAAGLVLPGDRIVEAEVARSLGISRVPVREALRVLESQGLVVNERYKGVRLMHVTPERLRQVLDVRVALETVAVRTWLAQGKTSAALERLSRCVEDMERVAFDSYAYGFANADTAFHREICRLSGNDVLCAMWEQLARQLTIIVGLSTLRKSKREIVQEHRALINVLSLGKIKDVERALEDHILTQNAVIDFERLVAEQRARTSNLKPNSKGKATKSRAFTQSVTDGA